MGFFWVKDNNVTSFQTKRFVVTLALCAALTIGGIVAETQGVDGGAAFLYGSAGGLLAVALGFVVGEGYRR